jgi:phosphopantothenoylcysteine decarboxylase/phosphopantothenate--cysteine ligase
MYTHAATAANLEILRSRGIIVVEPETGHLASGLVGLGRLADPDTILDTLRAVLGAGGDLSGRRVIVTAGGTREPIDPDRFIGNHSSGKMGVAIAEAARDRGARVTLIATTSALRVPGGVEVVRVEQALELLEALREHYPTTDALIMSAAVGDFRVEHTSEHKVKRGEHALDVKLVPNPDLVAETAAFATDRRPVRVGFAAETEDLLEHAQEKLARKSLDLIVANDVSADVFGSDSNQVTLLWSDGRRDDLPRMPKTDVAERVLDALLELLSQR